MKTHLIGIGGIGMSAIAQLLLARGERVSGSDSAGSELINRLKKLGGKIRVGHTTSNIDHPDRVVYSSSIAPWNPELMTARNRGIPVVPRGQMLGMLLKNMKTIAVAGSHGKSTTTGMVGTVLTQAGLDPTLVMGAEVEALGGNLRLGQSPYAVVESDESDGSFLWLEPAVGVITNVDDEHLDYYRSREEITQAYQTFISRVKPRGAVIGCHDDPLLRKLLEKSGKRWISYGVSPKAFLRAVRIEQEGGASRYLCLSMGKPLGEVELKVPGQHNVINSLAAIGAAHLLGIPFDQTAAALSTYQGAKRRFEVHSKPGQTMVVEDYGHHPVEIEATLKAARAMTSAKIFCVFQPHRYSRTRFLIDRFAGAFDLADELYLLPIYSASEDREDKDSDRALYEAVKSHGHAHVEFSTMEKVLPRIKSRAKQKDLVLILGAGDVGELAGRFVGK